MLLIGTRKGEGLRKRVPSREVSYPFFHEIGCSTWQPINLLETVKHNKYIGHKLQGVFYKIQQDDMFRST